MELNYFDLLSPEPMPLWNMGGVICPTLREISKITYNTYQKYLFVLSMTPKIYFNITGQSGYYEYLPDEQKTSFHIFDLIIQDRQILFIAEAALNFFLEYKTKYSEQLRCFLLYKSDRESPAGSIDKELWLSVCDIILQRNHAKQKNEDLSNIKSKKALSIVQKLQKGRENKQKRAKTDKNMELGNIISAVANKSNSLNIINIWDMTVYQLWDTFYRTCNNNVLDIQSMSVATWGDKNSLFDSAAWYKDIHI